MRSLKPDWYRYVGKGPAKWTPVHLASGYMPHVPAPYSSKRASAISLFVWLDYAGYFCASPRSVPGFLGDLSEFI